MIQINLTALYLDMDRERLQQGLYAYNGVLVGTSLVDYFTFQGLASGGWPIYLFLSVLLAPITLFMTLWLQLKVLGTNNTRNNINVPVLLLPYNIVMFMVLLSAKLWDSTMITQMNINSGESMVETAGVDLDNSTTVRFYGYQAVLNGIARIFLVEGAVTGFLILIGICCCSRILALSVISGTFVSSLVSLAVFDVPRSFLNAGYVGFNPALAAAGIFFYLVPSWKLTGLAAFWVILTMMATAAVDVVLKIL
jgi:urea transporter